VIAAEHGAALVDIGATTGFLAVLLGVGERHDAAGTAWASGLLGKRSRPGPAARSATTPAREPSTLRTLADEQHLAVLSC
jgi:hypothetical protein